MANGPLSPVQVLTVLIQRMERQVETYKRVNDDGYDVTIYELGRFADMLKRARTYLQSQRPQL